MTKSEASEALRKINVCWADAFDKEDVDEGRIKNDKLLSVVVYNAFNWFESHEGATYWSFVCVKLQGMEQ